MALSSRKDSGMTRPTTSLASHIAKRVDNVWLDLCWFVRVSMRRKLEKLWPFKSRADHQFEKAFLRAIGPEVRRSIGVRETDQGEYR
jgi:hypothetical protein